MSNQTVIVCDWCGRNSTPRKLMAQAADQAVSEGYRLSEVRKNVWVDLCPACWENQQ